MPSRVTASPPMMDMALVNTVTMDSFNETCFFTDDEEEFYEDSRLNKNLFKKFELHTPPQSPPHDPFSADSDPESLTGAGATLDLAYEECSMDFSLDEVTNLASMIIQDCMWSEPCLAAAGLITPGQNKKKSSLSSSSPRTGITSASKHGVTSKSNVVSSSSSPSSLLLTQPVSLESSLSQSSTSCSATIMMDINSDDCVSPAAVFPYPINEQQLDKAQSKSLNNSSTHYNLGSVAETPSPSESEDDEEIDVVTVVAEKMARRKQQQTHHHSKPAVVPSSSVLSFKSHVASIHNYSNTSSPPVSFSAPQSPQSSAGTPLRESSGSHKRSRPISMPASPQPAAKKSRSLLHSTTDLKRLKSVAHKLSLGPQASSSHHFCSSNSSRNSSDSEEGDTTKRAQHNVLERKRRNDLKYSFLKLRDNVPELANQERSPKVTILKLSAEYLREITNQNMLLESELERTRQRYERTKSKLMQLRRECL